MGTHRDALLGLAVELEAEEIQTEEGEAVSAAVALVVLEVLEERGVDLSELLDENEVSYPPEPED